MTSESLFRELCRYTQFGPSDHETLRAFHPRCEPEFSAIVERFYERLNDHEAARRVFQTPAQVERLRITLRHWLDRLLSGPWDDEYAERRLRIGRVHVQVNLPQRYMLSGMAVIDKNLRRVAAEVYADDAATLAAVNQALSRILHIDLALMLESYRADSMAENNRSQERAKRALSAKLEASEQRYHAVIETADVLVLIFDDENQITFANRKALAASKAIPDADGIPLEALFGAESNAFSAALDKVRAGETLSAFEVPLTDQETLVRWHVTSLGAGAGTCAIGMDITTERRLQDRSRRAERLASLGTLAAGLAHEIRNPLNAAQLQLTLLERRLASDSDKKTSGLVRDELVRLAHLVQDFLNFARPGSLRLAGCDLRQTAEAVVELLAPEAEKLRSTLSCETSTDPVAARVDEERIKQVLLNIIRNGLEATSNDGAVVVALAREGDSAVFRISDNGPGLPDDVDVFEPFSTNKESGTGLGLPIVHRIVSDHGGDISAGREGDRTVFRIELPLDGPPT